MAEPCPNLEPVLLNTVPERARTRGRVVPTGQDPQGPQPRGSLLLVLSSVSQLCSWCCLGTEGPRGWLLQRPSTARSHYTLHYSPFYRGDMGAPSGEVCARCPAGSKGPTWLLILNSTILSPACLCPKKAGLPPVSFRPECPSGHPSESPPLGRVQHCPLLCSSFVRPGAGFFSHPESEDNTSHFEYILGKLT